MSNSCRALQSILATPKGFRVTTPQAPIETEKARLKVLALHSVRDLIELESKHTTDDKVKLHLQEAYTDMTRAIYFAEAGR